MKCVLTAVIEATVQRHLNFHTNPFLGAANFQPRKCFVWCFYSENTFLETYCYFALEHSCLVRDIEVLRLKYYIVLFLGLTTLPLCTPL